MERNSDGYLPSSEDWRIRCANCGHDNEDHEHDDYDGWSCTAKDENGVNCGCVYFKTAKDENGLVIYNKRDA